MDRTIKQVLQHKGAAVWSIGPAATVYDAIKVMAERGIGALIITDANQRLVGILSERDYARHVILQGRSSRNTTVGEIMTHKVFYVSPEETVEECMAIMTHQHIRHLPVLENNSILGVVSIGDIVKAVIEDKKMLIRSLERYIVGH
jgi:signal-transduction protein with cAMP-binding, CBS, and nucleotidyltransferase domain